MSDDSRRYRIQSDPPPYPRTRRCSLYFIYFNIYVMRLYSYLIKKENKGTLCQLTKVRNNLLF